MVFWMKPFGTTFAVDVSPLKVSVNPCRVVQQFECRIKTKATKHESAVEGKWILQNAGSMRHCQRAHELRICVKQVTWTSKPIPLRHRCGKELHRSRILVCHVNERAGWIELNRLDCVFLFLSQMLRFTSLDLFYPACMTYDVSKGNTSPAFLSIVEAEFWKRITSARQSLIERCVKQANSVIAADTLGLEFFEKCINLTIFIAFIQFAEENNLDESSYCLSQWFLMNWDLNF